MRIISKFRDYYDSVMVYNQDHTHIYVRNVSTPDDYDDSLFNTIVKGQSRMYDPRDTNLTMSTIVIGFCGLIYPVYIFSYDKDVRGITTRKDVMCYSVDDVDKFVRNAKEAAHLIDKFDGKVGDRWTSFTRPKFTEFFKKHSGSDKFHHIFLKYDTPIFVATPLPRRGSTIEINTELGKYGFYKVFDAYSAYQELDMFVSGVLQLNEPTTIDIDDKYKIEGHGFDKFSFRKPPTKKRK